MGIIDADGNPGIEISDFFAAIGTGLAGATLDVRLDYKIATLSGAATISDVPLLSGYRF